MRRCRAGSVALVGAVVAAALAAAGPPAGATTAGPSSALSPAPAAAPSSAATPDTDPVDLAAVGRLMVVDLPGRALDGATRQLVARDHVGGVILFGRDIATSSQVTALDKAIHAAASSQGTLVMTDQEGGVVRRLPFDAPSVSAATAAKAGPHGVQALMAAAGHQLRLQGVDVDLAPDADLAGGFLGTRSYGSKPGQVDAAAVRGLQAGGADATAKHFPGLGRISRSTDDAAVRGPRVSAAMLAPFTSAVRAGVRLVLVDLAVHTGLGSGPAALQPQTYALLRGDRVGFTGVAITDALDAKAVDHPGEVAAAVQALRAGADLVLVPGGAAMARKVLQALRKAVADGEIPAGRLHEALARDAALEHRRGGTP